MQEPARDTEARPIAATPLESPASEALAMMVAALRLIDLGGGADVAGAHLDLAIHRLREWIETAPK